MLQYDWTSKRHSLLVQFGAGNCSVLGQFKNSWPCFTYLPCSCFGTPIMIKGRLLTRAFSIQIRFYARRLSVERNSYSDVAGWVAGWLSVTAGIVSKRLNVSQNFFDHLIAHHRSIRDPLRRYQIPRVTPSSGALNTRGGVKIGDFVRFSTYIA